MLGAFFYPKMPALMSAHWNSQGDINGYLPKFWVLFTIPSLSSVLFIVFIIIPQIDPIRTNIKKFGKYFNEFVSGVLLFLFYIYLLQIIRNLGFIFNFMRLISPGFAVMLFATGILMKNSKQNWFIGVRTPWTIGNKKVWDKTNTLGGDLFQFSAVLSLGGTLMPQLALLFIFLPVIFSSFYTIYYSYREYNRDVKAFE